MTLTQFIEYVTETFKRDDKNAEIIRAYNETIYDIASRIPLGNFEYQSYIPLVEAQEDYPLPTEHMHIINPLRYLDGSGTNANGNPLNHISKEEYDIIEPNPNRTDPSTGTPHSYCFFSHSILVTDLPSATVVAGGALLELNWTKTPAAQAAGSDTTSIRDVFGEILKWGTLWRLYASIGLDQDAAKWKGLYDDPNMGVPKILANQEDNTFTMGQVENNNL